MSFHVIASELFLEQVSRLDKKSRLIIHNKIELIKQNPFRFKKINSKIFSRVHRVRVSFEKIESRLIYVILEPNILLVCLLYRKDNYKFLEEKLKKLT